MPHVPGWPAAAYLLSPSTEKGRAQASGIGGSDQRQQKVFPGHRQCPTCTGDEGGTHHRVNQGAAGHGPAQTLIQPGMQEASCGCAGIYNAPVALQVYAQLFEAAGKLDHLEAFTSFNGADFYRLPRNTSRIELTKEAWTVPASYPYGTTSIVPLLAGQPLQWKVSNS